MIETEVSCITSVRGNCQRVQTSKHLLCMIEDDLGKEWSHICTPRLHFTARRDTCATYRRGKEHSIIYSMLHAIHRSTEVLLPVARSVDWRAGHFLMENVLTRIEDSQLLPSHPSDSMAASLISIAGRIRHLDCWPPACPSHGKSRRWQVSPPSSLLARLGSPRVEKMESHQQRVLVPHPLR